MKNMRNNLAAFCKNYDVMILKQSQAELKIKI